MLTLRRSHDRGHANHGWLDSYHTFSFANYYDPAHMQYRSLRVINEDYIAAGMGFGSHPHRDMEIVTYVLEGALEHKDSLGNGAIMRPGDVQRMTAGTGIVHSEFNPSAEEPTHLLQIWILPEQANLEPSYEQKYFPPEARSGKLRLIASRDGRDGSVVVHQDMNLYAALLQAGEQIQHPVSADRHFWVQVARGTVQINGEVLEAGDAAAIDNVTTLGAIAQADAEFLVFDLA
ncbi:pirin family protein [Alkalinema sp. FACHB-956]|uniref:pirin family protein n=1 Tax=Alkalinema sp. FACHB-956 TaxID=2692768 RepID=UPI001681E820|nr:pirin family protein [Alkalinema sp. FACHB-956]MBD2328867.1 pirin family protein [Alkalinema sp. FACHB-956]